MQSNYSRILAVLAVLAAVGTALPGCDGSNVEVTGIGASTGLPGGTMTGSNEIGVGNVNWVGNPRW